MNLIADIGNSRLKMALFERGRMVAETVEERCDTASLERLVRELFLRAGTDRCAGAILSSTRGTSAGNAAVGELARLMRARSERFVEFTPSTPVPIGNAYLTPSTLGRDRLAAAVGAATCHPGRNVLIADFGSALTVDLVTADGTFRGGVISPGLGMRFRALHDYTASLPLCGPGGGEELSECGASALRGLSTGEAIRLGVVNSLCFEVEGYIARMRGEFDGLLVIFTGGDAKYFVKRIKNTIFANHNLVFCGLDRILAYNTSEETLD